ncbi:F0F1 ATP synthase subunit A [Mycoplasma sp. Pen4]|uniref:F0F1 ATP synthase subunit A n=1 Tax=Mycoplasma sp. Pen4 TaxID=640330 RepID=UPI00165498A2|nr:F0F1 ATP synthase subunit A [Mycoplasma sp. Pen4]QNM93724.1 F0F1 ATP synthase subunit A [Mycoplasma sp. Pen4]
MTEFVTKLAEDNSQEVSGIGKYIENWNQPQLLSLLVTVLIVLVISMIVYVKVSRVKPNEAPKGVALIAEAYVGVFDNTFDETTGGERIQKSRLYIFGLGTFIFIGNLIGMLGFEPIVTSYSVPLTLALMSWLGILISGAIYHRWRYLKVFINPLEIVGKFSPLVSLSFRIYGNIIGGATVLFLFYSVFGWVWTLIPGIGTVTGENGQVELHRWYFLAVFFSPALHMYFDLFGSTLQAYLFTLLTLVYWTVESSNEEAILPADNDNAEVAKVKQRRWFKKAQKLKVAHDTY